MRRLLHTLYEYLALWFGLALLGIMCLLWSPVSFLLHHAMPRAMGGEFGRYMNMFWFRHYLWMLAMSGSVAGANGSGRELTDVVAFAST